MAATKLADIEIKNLRVLCFGAGSAGIGISEQIATAIASDKKVSKEEAMKQIFCFDREGLLVEDQDLSKAQQPFAKPQSNFQDVDLKSLSAVIDHIKPNVLLGVSTVPGAFTQEVVETMAKHVERPIIFPLSNPTRLHEAKPKDLIEWTKGKALVATGSPFDPVKYGAQTFNIGECNNSVCFPGIGLACVLGRTKILSDSMLVAAIHALANEAPAVKDKDPTQPLCPGIEEAREVSVKIAMAVLKQAGKEGSLGIEVEDLPLDDDKKLHDWIKSRMWEAEYEELTA